MAGDDRSVDRLVGLRAMAALALDHDLELVGPAIEGAGPDGEGSLVHVGDVVHPVDLVDGEAVEEAVVHHHAGAAAAFLGWLEDHHDRAREIACFGKVSGRPQKHRRVPVVPAGVHHPGCRRGIVDARRLGDRKRIHVGAQSHGAPAGPAPADHADDPVARKPGDHLVAAEFAQLLGNEGARPHGFEHQFGVGVDLAPPGGDLGLQFGEAVSDRHTGGSSATVTRQRENRPRRNVNGPRRPRDRMPAAGAGAGPPRFRSPRPPVPRAAA